MSESHSHSTAIPWTGPILDPAAKYGIAGDIVRAIEPYSEAESTAILAQLLVAAGNAIGRGPYYEVAGSKHRLNLFAALVGSSSTGRKGTSYSYVRELMSIASPDWAARHTTPGLVSGAGLVRQFAELGDDARLLVGGGNLCPVLRAVHQHSGVLREGWDGNPLSILRSKDPLCVKEPHLSMIGHVTDEELKETLRRCDKHNGMANRFMWIRTGRVRLLPDGGCVPEDVMRGLAERLADSLGRAKEIGRIIRSPAASVLWEETYEALELRPHTDASVVTDRASAQVLRLSCLYAVLDGSDVIDVQHLRAATALWRFAQDSAEEIFNRPTSVATRISRALAPGRRMSRTEIRDMLGRDASQDEIEHALCHLRDTGVAFKRMEATAGRPREIWTGVAAA
jgi:hypothetical protein